MINLEVNNVLQHSNYEKELQRMINLERNKKGLSNIELFDNLTQLSNLKVKELIKSGDLTRFNNETKKQNIALLLNYYNIKNYKTVFQFFGKSSGMTMEKILESVKANNKELILNPEVKYISLSCEKREDSLYWVGFVLLKSDDLDENRLKEYREEVIKLVNQERKRHGLNELKKEDKLMKCAQTRAKEQVKREGHQRPNGESYETIIGDEGMGLGNNYMIGENIANGQETPQEVVRGWLNSKGHRENILNKDYSYIGVGVYMRKERLYWTQIFYSGKM